MDNKLIERDKLKILFITDIPSPYRVDFFNELNQYCNLTVIFERKYSGTREITWIKNKGFKFKGVFLNNSQKRKFSIKQIKKILNTEKFDLIIIGCYSTIIGIRTIMYLKRKKINFVISADGGMIKNDERKIMYNLKKYLIGSAKYWLSTGKNTNEYLKYYGAKESGIYLYPFSSIKDSYIQNKLNKSEIKALKKENNIKEEKIILSVGRFIFRKGFDVLINVMKNLDKNIGLYIVGGNPTEEYMKIVEENKLNNVHFIEFKNQEELENYYRVADVFVFPTRGDIWGLVINEAMAKGLPIITTNKCVAGLELIEDGKNGFIVPVDNIEELKNAIEKIISDEKLQETMSKSNIEKIKKYTIENMAKVHVEIFEKILNEERK